MTKFDFAAFKQTINLSQYAASQGYQLDKGKSTRSSLAMCHPNGDKIIISKKEATWVYFSVFDDRDNGTIIDFIKNRTNKDFAAIGRELTAWTGDIGVLPVYDMPTVREQVYDLARIQNAYRWLTPAGSHPYLTQERQIPEDVLNNRRFNGRIFQDRYDNVVFPHWDNQGICGLELKNAEKGVFMRGSEKSMWVSQIYPSDISLVLTEGAIDALSHYTIFSPADTAYGAVSGGMRDKQFDFLLTTIETMPHLTTIVLAVDNDQGGDQIASRIENFLKDAFTGELIRDIPPQHDWDWNNVLKAKQQSRNISTAAPRI